MDEVAQLVATHGYLFLAGWVLVDQLGVPIPAIPVLVMAGALSGAGKLELELTIAVAALAAIPSDLFWYQAGRLRGGTVLRVLCRLSLEPDSCVRSTEETFVRHGPRSLLVAKFIPGYQTLAAALAGMSGIPLHRYLAYDVPAAFLWSSAYIGLGYLFHGQIDWVLQAAADAGFGAAMLLIGLLVAYVGWRYFHRQRFLRKLRIARIAPAELKQLLDLDALPSIVDLRNALEIEMDPHRIPGARVMTLEEVEIRHAEIPRDCDVILYCT
jgi:membrane protein DedA with SNARE-associated domain